MPTLNWIGKEAVVNHHHEVPFRLLKDVPELACGEPGAGAASFAYQERGRSTTPT